MTNQNATERCMRKRVRGCRQRLSLMTKMSVHCSPSLPSCSLPLLPLPRRALISTAALHRPPLLVLPSASPLLLCSIRSAQVCESLLNVCIVRCMRARDGLDERRAHRLHASVRAAAERGADRRPTAKMDLREKRRRAPRCREAHSDRRRRKEGRRAEEPRSRAGQRRLEGGDANDRAHVCVWCAR
jgi:hypothetical protein